MAVTVCREFDRSRQIRGNAQVQKDTPFCEMLLPPLWGHDFSKIRISDYKCLRAANDMPLALFLHLFGLTFGGQVGPTGVQFLIILN